MSFLMPPSSFICAQDLKCEIQQYKINTIIGRVIPLSDSATRSNIPFVKIHCDVWGSTPIVSIENFKYCAPLVDYCTRFIWFYPIYNKFDMFSFCCLFENFDAKIKCLQKDGGGQFIVQHFL